MNAFDIDPVNTMRQFVCIACGDESILCQEGVYLGIQSASQLYVCTYCASYVNKENEECHAIL